jgi:hypothetical protein
VSTLTKIQFRILAWQTCVSIAVIFIASDPSEIYQARIAAKLTPPVAASQLGAKPNQKARDETPIEHG